MTEAERAAADAVRARIASACERADRDPADVTLVAATKTVEPARILRAGVLDVGENRVQELVAKAAALAGSRLRWHFIGALQRNKVGRVVGLADLIHSLDSMPLARAVGKAAAEREIRQPVLVEVNVSGEPSKAGISPDAVGAFVEEAGAIPGLKVDGLMGIPAPGDLAAAREAFRLLARLAAAAGLPHLSMGMTDDFEIAVEEGATMVRVGSAIFGPRPPAR